MRTLAACALAAALAACGPRLDRPFRLGVVLPLGPRAAEAAARLGLDLTDAPPPGAALEPAEENGAVASAARLRFLWSRGAAEGRAGVYFVLPPAPAGRELTDYPEEWQALARSAREAGLLRPVIEGGAAEPIETPDGLSAAAWRFAGRRYAVYVNAAPAAVALPDAALADARALLEPRSDPRESLTPCGAGLCLRPGGVLWLEGRLGAASPPVPEPAPAEEAP